MKQCVELESTRVTMVTEGIKSEVSRMVKRFGLERVDALRHSVKCWNSNSMGTKGYVKEGLELTPMGSFNIGQRGCQLQT